MKKAFTIIIGIFLLLTACTPQPTSEVNVETAVAELQNDFNVDTAVAQINLTMTAIAAGTEMVLPPTDTPQPSPVPSLCTLNQPCQAAGVEVTVTAVSTTGEIGAYWKAQTGNTYVVIDVTIKNLERDQLPYNPVWFTLTDAQGTTIIANSFAPLPDLKNGILTKGSDVSGKVTFEVSDQASGFIVTFLPLDLLGGYLPVQIDLGQ
jgi:hypothetical protein